MRLAAMILGLIGTVFGGLIAAMGLGAFGGTYWAYGAGEGGARIWVASFAVTAEVAAAVALVGAVSTGWWPRPAAVLMAVAALLGLPAGGVLWALPFLLLLAAAALAWGAERGEPRALPPAGRTFFRAGASALAVLGAAAGAAGALLELGWFGPEYVGGTGHGIDPVWHDVLVGGAFALAVLAVAPAILALWRPTLSASFLAGAALVGFPLAAGRIYFWEMTDRWHLPATCLLFAAVFARLGREAGRERTAAEAGPVAVMPTSGPAPTAVTPPTAGASPAP